MLEALFLLIAILKILPSAEFSFKEFKLYKLGRFMPKLELTLRKIYFLLFNVFFFFDISSFFNTNLFSKS